MKKVFPVSLRLTPLMGYNKNVTKFKQLFILIGLTRDRLARNRFIKRTIKAPSGTNITLQCECRI